MLVFDLEGGEDEGRASVGSRDLVDDLINELELESREREREQCRTRRRESKKAGGDSFPSKRRLTIEFELDR